MKKLDLFTICLFCRVDLFGFEFKHVRLQKGEESEDKKIV